MAIQKDKNTTKPTSVAQQTVALKAPAPLKAPTDSRLMPQASLESDEDKATKEFWKREQLQKALERDKVSVTAVMSADFIKDVNELEKLDQAPKATPEKFGKEAERTANIIEIATTSSANSEFIKSHKFFKNDTEIQSYSRESFKNVSPADKNDVDLSKIGKKLKVDKNLVLDGSFEQSFQIVVASEGGFSNHKADKGGATIFGVASKANPKEYAEIMSHLKRGDKEGAMQITMETYKTKYWDKVKGIDELSPSAKLIAFDAAINSGTGYANKLVEKSHGDDDHMKDLRLEKYNRIIAKDPSQAVFKDGWFNRIAKLDKITDISEKNSTETFNPEILAAADKAIDNAKQSSRTALADKHKSQEHPAPQPA